MRAQSYILPIVLPLLSAAVDSSPQATLLNMGEVFTADDYPTIAQRDGDEGEVIVVVGVDRSGLATSCTIKRSSGHASLDEQTCALFRARARFEPARDSHGRALTSTFEKNIVWRLEGEATPPLPRQAWVARVTLSFDSSGTIVACKAEGIGTPSLKDACPPLDKATEAKVAQQPAAEAITETLFYPVDFAKLKIPSDRTDATKLAQQVSAIEIDDDGRVTGCQGMRYSGNATEETDACSLTSTMRFSSSGGERAAMKGTMIMTLYLRQHRVT